MIDLLGGEEQPIQPQATGMDPFGMPTQNPFNMVMSNQTGAMVPQSTGFNSIGSNSGFDPFGQAAPTTHSSGSQYGNSNVFGQPSMPTQPTGPFGPAQPFQSAMGNARMNNTGNPFAGMQTPMGTGGMMQPMQQQQQQQQFMQQQQQQQQQQQFMQPMPTNGNGSGFNPFSNSATAMGNHVGIARTGSPTPGTKPMVDLDNLVSPGTLRFPHAMSHTTGAGFNWKKNEQQQERATLSLSEIAQQKQQAGVYTAQGSQPPGAGALGYAQTGPASFMQGQQNMQAGAPFGTIPNQQMAFHSTGKPPATNNPFQF
jgi:hypothetical protein